MDGYGALERRQRGIFVLGCRERAGGEGRQDRDKTLSFGGFGEGLRVVAGSEAPGPGGGPDLEEVDPVVGFILFRVCNACGEGTVSTRFEAFLSVELRTYLCRQW